MACSLVQLLPVIRYDQPDLLLLQESDDGSSPTDDQDQQALIPDRITDLYHSIPKAYHWKSA
ncbi:hypothetical protein [Pseudomonas aeruginosa]|uniref:hypothetical protein n=1 Tax=Pseudomonas aeruginosa TaxID=287 RepID=UPI003F8072F4